MLPEELRCKQEEICCWRRYVIEGDMLLEEICCCRRYVIEGDILLEEICCWKRYQRRYLAQGVPSKRSHH